MPFFCYQWHFSLFKLKFTVGIQNKEPPTQSTYIILEAGEASRLQKPYLLWSTNTPAEMSLIKTQLQGSCSELPLCVHRFAAMQTSSSLRKIQVQKKKKKVFWKQHSPKTILLVGKPFRSQRHQKHHDGNYRNYLWHYHRFQWSLGNGQTKKTILKYSNTARYVVPKEAFVELTCMKWQDRQWAWITIFAMCSPPAFLN